MNNIFKALNDETRREILNILSKEVSLNASEIYAHFEISKPSISHHLAILKNAGLVTSEKKGQYIHYSLHTTVLQDLFTWIMKLNG